MSLSNFRLPLPQPELEFVKVIADENKIRAVAQINRNIIEDRFPGHDYHRDRFAIVSRNLGLLAPVIQAKFDTGKYTDYRDSLGIASGNDKLIIIDGSDVVGLPLA
jgi:hypothetical protein